MSQNNNNESQVKKIEEKAMQIARPIVEELGFSLWDVCYEKEGAMWYLRVLFDKDGGIDSDECEKVTTPLNDAFDKEDFIKNVDILDIGSPGLTKRLRNAAHFKASIGEPVRIITKESGIETTIYGILQGFDDYTLTILQGEKEAAIVLADCMKININL